MGLPLVVMRAAIMLLLPLNHQLYEFPLALLKNWIALGRYQIAHGMGDALFVEL